MGLHESGAPLVGLVEWNLELFIVLERPVAKGRGVGGSGCGADADGSDFDGCAAPTGGDGGELCLDHCFCLVILGLERSMWADEDSKVREVAIGTNVDQVGFPAGCCILSVDYQSVL